MTEQTSTPSPAESEALSPAESAYFSSKGEDVSGLPAPSEQDGERLLRPESDQPPPPQQAQSPDGDDEPVEGEIVLDEAGRPRDAKTNRFVPHSALHKERERRKEVEAKERANGERLARAEERLTVLNEILSKAQVTDEPGQAQPQQQQAAKSVFEEEPVDPMQDIFAAFDQQRRLVSELMKAQREGSQKFEETRKADEAQRAEAATIEVYRADAQRFVSENPSFADAYAFLINQRHVELEAQGVADPKARNEQIVQEERQLVRSALGSQRSPAEMLFKIAQARGFSSAQKPPAQSNVGVQKLDNIRRGQVASASLSGAGGGSPSESLTIEALADMSENDFIALSSRLGKSKMRELMGAY